MILLFFSLLSNASTTLLSLPFTRLNPSSSSNQLAYQICFSMPRSALDWWAQRRALHSGCVTPVREKNDLHQHADSTLHNPIQTAADLLCYRGTVTAYNLSFMKTGKYSSGCFSANQSPAWTDAHFLIGARSQTSLCWPHKTWPVKSSGLAAQPSRASITPSNSILSADLLMSHH